MLITSRLSVSEEVDTDRLKLKQEIQASLQRLEKETLINRNGELFSSLTNEEREVGREIKSVDLSANDQTKVLAELLFAEVLGDVSKFRYKQYRRDYDNQVVRWSPLYFQNRF